MPAEGWYVDGVSLENYGRVIEDRSGWDDMPAPRGGNTTMLGRHGDLWRRKKFGPGKKSLVIAVHGLNPDGSLPDARSERRARYEQHLDDLTRLVSPLHRPVVVERVHANGDHRRAECEVLSPLVPDPRGDDYGLVGVEFTIPGAFWEDVDPLAYRLPFQVGGAATQTVEAYNLRGQTGYCADAIVRVYGPVSAGFTIADPALGSGFTYSAAIGSGSVLVVDAGAFTAYMQASPGTSVLGNITMQDAQLLEIGPAPAATEGPSLTVTAPGASGAFRVVVEARRKWLR